MSFYPIMFQPDEDCSQYLLQFNGHGEIICYAMNGDGKATSFATGSINHVLDEPIRTASKGMRWIGRPFYEGESPKAWGFRHHATWSSVAAALNGKTGARRTDARAVYRTLAGTGASIKEFVISGDGYHYFLGPKAEAYDKQIAEMSRSW